MMPPDVYLEARRSAEHHVQAQIESVRFPEIFPGEARIDARVGSVFTGDESMRGNIVTFGVSTMRRDDSVPIGGTIWMSAEALVQGVWLEVFLNGHPPRCEVALWQMNIIAEPTAIPTMNSTEL